MKDKIKEVKNFRKTMNVLVKPLTEKELAERSNKEDIISEKIIIDFNDIIFNDIEWLNDYASEAITGSEVGLTDISYEIVGRTTNNEAIVEVKGEVYYDGLT